MLQNYEKLGRSCNLLPIYGSFKEGVILLIEPMLMKFVTKLLPVFLFAIVSNSAFGQWTSTVPILGSLPIESSAITYKGGIAWAGCTHLYRSPDSGVTWRQMPDFLDPLLTDRINDIEFFDSMN